MCDYLILINPLNDNQFTVKNIGINITSFKERINSELPVRNIKSRFDILKYHSRMHSEKLGFDECFYFSNEYSICNSSCGQVAFIINDIIHFQNNTADFHFLILVPKLIDILGNNNISYKINIETTENILLYADEILLINDIQGIMWVQKFKNRRYTNRTARLLTSLLNTNTKNPQTSKSSFT